MTSDYPFDLGSYARKVTTSSAEAQVWFDRGLVWTYAYHHEEAIACFERAITADAQCAMAFWGIAFAIGPNYNKPWEAFEEDEKPECLQKALRALETAQNLLETQPESYSEPERALIGALHQRYPSDPNTADFSRWDDSYASSMGEAYQEHSRDLDVCCFYVEALMNRTPWKLWNLKTGQPAEGASTLEAAKVLETAFDEVEGAWEHPGLLHMYIHLMEMSGTPERALRHGDVLSGGRIVPDAGHLVHMGTHVDVLCGDYQNVVARNHAAIVADEKYVAYGGTNNFYSIYRCHNYHFKLYGAMFLGQPRPALEAATQLIEAIPLELLQSLADWFEAFIPMKQHVLVRFGKWQDILEQELPTDPNLYCFTIAMMRYARTVALANLGRFDEAEKEKALFLQARDAVPDSRMLFNNTCRDVMAVAEQMLSGELEYHKGNHTLAFEHLRKSVQLDDNLPYDEPWGWMQPPRHALGALLLEQGRYSEAEIVYREDLGLVDKIPRACQHPNNVWSLHGLHECLLAKSDGEARVEAKHVKLLLDKAAARATIKIQASCFCRQK